jgi:small subunit ribosomal protein S11
MAKIKEKKASKSLKLKQKTPIIRLHLTANLNNSILVMTNMQHEVMAWCSSGKVGFKGTKKATPFAAQKITEEILEKAKMVEASSVHIVINGAGMGRESFLRSIQSSGLQVESIKDVTSFPFGGPKRVNRRRI